MLQLPGRGSSLGHLCYERTQARRKGGKDRMSRGKNKKNMKQRRKFLETEAASSVNVVKWAKRVGK